MVIRLIAALFLSLAALAPARADNPFGLMLWPAPGADLSLTAARAAALGVAWFRPPSQFIDRWRTDQNCGECRRLRQIGLSLALTVRNGGRDSLPRRPSTPPTDLVAYKKILSRIADQWHPALLVIEDEENQPTRFSDGRELGVWDSGGGTAAAYGAELGAACDVAHQRHILCTNGGLSFEAATGLTWWTLLREDKPDLACDYARRTAKARSITTDTLCRFKTAAAVPASIKTALLRNAEALLPIYRTSPIDMVNFHWFGSDAVALAETIDRLHSLTDKPLMSNEIGQRPDAAASLFVRPILRAAIAGGLRVAIWFSVDGPDSLSLFEPDGRLRSGGEEFAHQMSGRK